MNDLWGIFKSQTQIMLKGFRETIEFIPESLYPKTVCGYPVWHQIYHTIYSTDLFFFNPVEYVPPSFHTPGLNDLGIPPSQHFTKDELLSYFTTLEQKVLQHIDRIDAGDATDRISKSRWTRFDVMIGQHRHVYFHLGWLWACLKSEGLGYPEWVGITRDWEVQKP